MSRAYNPDIDSCYDANSMPDIYLTDEQVQKALTNITDSSSESEAIKELIVMVETLQRKKCLGEISASDCSVQKRKIQKHFGDKFGRWAFQTKAYEDFYSQFGEIAR